MPQISAEITPPIPKNRAIKKLKNPLFNNNKNSPKQNPKTRAIAENSSNFKTYFPSSIIKFKGAKNRNLLYFLSRFESGISMCLYGVKSGFKTSVFKRFLFLKVKILCSGVISKFISSSSSSRSDEGSFINS